MLFRYLRERRRSRAAQGLLDQPARQPASLASFVEKAAVAFDAPYAALSVIEGDRQWIRAACGFATGPIPRAEGFCSHALDRPGMLEVCDLLQDARFASLPLVEHAPGIRYYIGAPLRLTDGTAVGVLCVADTRLRDGSADDQKAYLSALARQAALTIETGGAA